MNGYMSAEWTMDNGKMALMMEIFDVKHVHDMEVLKQIKTECDDLIQIHPTMDDDADLYTRI